VERTLTEVLHDYAVNHRARFEERRACWREWIDSVTRLVDRIRGWLTEADKEGVLRTFPRELEFIEKDLGRCEVPGLLILLGDRRVKIRPRRLETTGRNGVRDGEPRLLGEVDVWGLDGGARMYRAADGQGGRWLLQENKDDEPVPLTRERSEALLVRLLRGEEGPRDLLYERSWYGDPDFDGILDRVRGQEP
jgi:hypothetical protein